MVGLEKGQLRKGSTEKRSTQKWLTKKNVGLLIVRQGKCWQRKSSTKKKAGRYFGKLIWPILYSLLSQPQAMKDFDIINPCDLCVFKAISDRKRYWKS